MARVMLISVGTGKGVEDGISKSIIEANPGETVFITVKGKTEYVQLYRVCD